MNPAAEQSARAPARAPRRLPIPLRLAAAALPVLLAGCNTMITPTVQVREPSTALPVQASAAVLAAAPAPASDGAIFNRSSYRGLFEDRRARLVGDVLTIQIQERHSAKQSSGSSVDRNGKLDAKVGVLPWIDPAKLTRAAASGSSQNSFEGKGETGTENDFTGVITVTVIEVLPNGNLVVAGEKQVGINQNVEGLRFSGVVDPATVQFGNVVNSTQVSDARLEVRGRGDIDRAQTSGWLARFFLSFMPI